MRAAGHEALVSPLLIPRPLAWEPPAGPVDAVLLTSPQAPALAGPAASLFHGLPAFAVGERTAAGAREAGFEQVRVEGRDVAALLRTASDAGYARLLHLCGRERTEVEIPQGMTVETRVVYVAELAGAFEPDALDAMRVGIDWALLFSARTAGRFAELFDTTGLSRRSVAVAAISGTALAAAGSGWKQGAVASIPSEAGVLAAAGLLCDKPAE